MRHILVAVMNGSKARFLTLESCEIPEFSNACNLVEQDSLFNSEHEMTGQELWSNSKTGRNRSTSSQAHSYDDHRQQHRVEYERRFAGTIAQRLLTLLKSGQTQHFILVAEPQFLGIVRETLLPLLPKGLDITKLAKDLCNLTPTELQAYLAQKNLLPALPRITR
ncbi:host attachment protein [Alkalinema pantanalense CENA528]|uniref:host attachment protein n=1 Tax=Alkalinema pantanalense TaxID=1620705 RepID=UPI003D6FE79C